MLNFCDFMQVYVFIMIASCIDINEEVRREKYPRFGIFPFPGRIIIFAEEPR